MGSADTFTPSMHSFSPLERIVLSANGNLQRLVSSFYNSPVTVTQVYNRRVEPGTYERQVTLSVLDQVFGAATSTIEVSRSDVVDAIEKRGIAIGQIFRHFDILPEFALHEAGHDGEDHFWRQYSLDGNGIMCRIHERLSVRMFELQSPCSTGTEPTAGAPSETTPAPAAATSSLGDIMSPNVTGLALPDGFTPLQRILLTANGNVERLVSSYYCEPVTTFVTLNHRRSDAVYDRQIALLVRGEQFMSAKSTIFFTSPEWLAKVEQEGTPLGSLFRVIGEMPSFQLRSTGRGLKYFWRVYTLTASGMTCEITETFSDSVFSDKARSDDLERAPSTAGYTVNL